MDGWTEDRLRETTATQLFQKRASVYIKTLFHAKSQHLNKNLIFCSQTLYLSSEMCLKITAASEPSLCSDTAGNLFHEVNIK